MYVYTVSVYDVLHIATYTINSKHQFLFCFLLLKDMSIQLKVEEFGGEEQEKGFIDVLSLLFTPAIRSNVSEHQRVTGVNGLATVTMSFSVELDKTTSAVSDRDRCEILPVAYGSKDSGYYSSRTAEKVESYLLPSPEAVSISSISVLPTAIPTASDAFECGCMSKGDAAELIIFIAFLACFILGVGVGCIYILWHCDCTSDPPTDKEGLLQEFFEEGIFVYGCIY